MADEAEDSVPFKSFECPITHMPMEDPVVGSDGISYERSAITNWLSKHNFSPMNPAKRMRISELVPNMALRSIMEETGRKCRVIGKDDFPANAPRGERNDEREIIDVDDDDDDDDSEIAFSEDEIHEDEDSDAIHDGALDEESEADDSDTGEDDRTLFDTFDVVVSKIDATDGMFCEFNIHTTHDPECAYDQIRVVEDTSVGMVKYKDKLHRAMGAIDWTKHEMPAPRIETRNGTSPPQYTDTVVSLRWSVDPSFWVRRWSDENYASVLFIHCTTNRPLVDMKGRFVLEFGEKSDQWNTLRFHECAFWRCVYDESEVEEAVYSLFNAVVNTQIHRAHIKVILNSGISDTSSDGITNLMPGGFHVYHQCLRGLTVPRKTKIQLRGGTGCGGMIPYAVNVSREDNDAGGKYMTATKFATAHMRMAFADCLGKIHLVVLDYEAAAEHIKQTRERISKYHKRHNRAEMHDLLTALDDVADAVENAEKYNSYGRAYINMLADAHRNQTYLGPSYPSTAYYGRRQREAPGYIDVTPEVL